MSRHPSPWLATFLRVHFCRPTMCDARKDGARRGGWEGSQRPHTSRLQTVDNECPDCAPRGRVATSG